MTDGTEGGFLERLRNSPRTVSTIIVILIVVGAIFAFSDQGQQPGAPTVSPAPTEVPPPEGSPTPKGETTPAPKGGPTPTPLPEARETEEAYMEVATRGDGATHLARRALLRSLEAGKPGFELTAEHKVWIEDYVKDRISRKSLALGESVTITKGLVREGIENSKGLTDAQLQHLKRYSRLVAAYR
ncbi:MAG: Uncharacterized protein G01um101438_608 [Parcubacteria group bacterium Gr01-1014_38]|nr:MAG: Uncharacterized protein G01um101438_608 [Parcubacteria group bacterium Gr01-1014_38]